MSSYVDVVRTAMSSAEEEISSNALLVRGENGTLEHTAAGVGEARVALFFALVRGISEDRLVELMNACLGDLSDQEIPSVVADLFVLAFQTRDCRGGKGERDLFYKMIMHLHKQYPNTVYQVLTLFGEYGYFKDFFKLIELTDGVPEFTVLSAKITDLIANQLIADEAILEGKPGTASTRTEISLCAKYCPREGKHFAVGKNSTVFSDLVNKLYPPTGAHKQGRKQYRQLIAKLTKALDVPEVKMCGKRFSELEFAKVHSVCAKKFCKAFLNEKVKAIPTPAEEETGNRFPDSEDRIMCRQNLRQAAVDQKVKGKQLFPHDIVETLFNGRTGVSSLEKEVYNAQWKDIRANLLAQLAAAQGEGGEAKAVNVGKLVPLSDVSGSMNGTPMIVSIALGILVSEVNHPAFRDRVLTFESQPQWVDLSTLSTIAQKVEKLRHAPWGGSTDVNMAFAQILQVVREKRLAPEDIPDLIIFSDMQFDEAVGRGSQQTQLEQLKSMFHDVGIEISGKPYPAPKIIFWNLRGDTVGFPAQAEDENVQMLSGFSPSLLKYVLEGGELEETVEVVTETGEVVKVAKAKPTPYETVRKVLDDARYIPVRELLSASTEGALAQYHFEAPPSPAATEP
jgi:hypothetical protein